MIRTISMLGLLLVAVGCAGTGRGPGTGGGDLFGGTESRSITVVVTSQYPGMVRIRAVSTGGRDIIGSINFGERTSFTVAWPNPRELRFQLEPLSRQSYVTPGFMVYPGTRLELTVRNPLHTSSVR